MPVYRTAATPIPGSTVTGLVGLEQKVSEFCYVSRRSVKWPFIVDEQEHILSHLIFGVIAFYECVEAWGLLKPQKARKRHLYYFSGVILEIAFGCLDWRVIILSSMMRSIV